MQISKQRLTAAQQLALVQLRFLDLYDEVGGAENILDLPGDRGAGRLVVGVIEAYPRACAALNEDLVSGIDEFANARRHQTHTILVNFDFFGDADFHEPLRDKPLGWQGYSPGSLETIQAAVTFGNRAQFFHEQALPEPFLACSRRAQRHSVEIRLERGRNTARGYSAHKGLDTRPTTRRRLLQPLERPCQNDFLPGKIGAEGKV